MAASVRLTTRGRYAVAAMLDLAMHADSGPVCVAAIAKRQGISPAYLERLFRSLRDCGLVCSTRGAHGGYQLCHCAGEINVAQIINAVGEPLDATRCQASAHNALTEALWVDLTRHVHSFLEATSLAKLCCDQRGSDQVAMGEAS